MERALLPSPLQQLQAVVQRGIEALHWNSGEAVVDFLTEAGGVAQDVLGLVEAVQGNATRMRALVAHWKKDVMLERKEGKVVNNIVLPQHARQSPAQVYSFAELQTLTRDSIATRHGLVADGSREATRLLAATHKTIKAVKGSRAWREYVAAMSDMMLDGIVAAVQSSGVYLVHQVRCRSTMHGPCDDMQRCCRVTRCAVAITTHCLRWPSLQALTAPPCCWT